MNARVRMQRAALPTGAVSALITETTLRAQASTRPPRSAQAWWARTVGTE
jgi:hypothetical protein